jgi:Mrp family chromosome partitioning ATPase
VAAALQRAGGQLSLAHTVEVLDASLRGRSVHQLTRGLALALPDLPAGRPPATL